MLGLKRRKRQEGWAMDVDPNDERQNVGCLQRISDNNKLWVGSLITVCLLAIILVWTSSRGVQPPQEYGGQPGYSGKGTYNDSDHTKFAVSFAKSKSYGTAIDTAQFVDQEHFEIIVSQGVSADEIDYAARMAAQIILEKFRQRVIVEVYDEDAAGKHFLANTLWNEEKLGYVVKFNKSRFGTR
ncbi:hypothetical protein LLG46_14105 [bacterium]|nr:hypothetical protein [bacterium]